jgi:hypothetical protein
LARARAAQAFSSARLGDLGVAIPAAEEARRLTQETDQPFVFGVVCASQAQIAALRGDHEQADQLAAEAERAGLAVGARPILATVQTPRASLRSATAGLPTLSPTYAGCTTPATRHFRWPCAVTHHPN